MALTERQRGELISHLVTNCPTWQYQGAGDVLAQFPDAQLAHFKEVAEKQHQAAEVANAAAHGNTDKDTGFTYRVNPDNGKWEKQRVQPVVPVANEADDDEDDDEAYRDKKNAKRMAGQKSKPPVANADDGLEDYVPRNRPQTIDQYADAAPTAEIRNELSELLQLKQQQKDAVIAQLIDHIPSANDRQAHYVSLNKLSLNELKMELARRPQPAVEEELDRTAARNARKQPARVADDDDNILPTPTLNDLWAEMDGKGKKEAPAPAPATLNFDPAELSEEEYLQNAPPSVRNKVQWATANYEEKRRELIANLVSDIHDDDKAREMAAEFRQMTLKQLERVAEIASKREANKPVPRFFGSAPALNALAPRPSYSADDILPTPTLDFADSPLRKAR